jgi:hypothetical protein
MRFRTALSVATLFLVCFTVAVWATPVGSATPAMPGSEPETQTVSGRIAAVGESEFTIEVKQNQQSFKVKFILDGNTKVEGKLAVGSKATVDYRSEAGNNLASLVSVVPVSSLQSE